MTRRNKPTGAVPAPPLPLGTERRQHTVSFLVRSLWKDTAFHLNNYRVQQQPRNCYHATKNCPRPPKDPSRSLLLPANRNDRREVITSHA